EPPAIGQALRNPDPDQLEAVPSGPHDLGDAFDLGEDVLEVAVQAAAGRGELHAVRRAVEQRLPELPFQGVDLPAERRLGHVEQPGGLAHGPDLRDLPEIGELAQFHGRIMHCRHGPRSRQALDACPRPGEGARVADFDVVVVGGGAAGIAAAVGAARSGSEVCLIEQYGFLGGAATNSSVLTHCGFFDQTGAQVVRGVGQEVLDRLDAHRLYRTHTVPESGNTIVLLDLETTKTVYDELVTSAGVELLLHSTLVGATTEEGRITGVEVAHRGGRERIT